MTAISPMPAISSLRTKLTPFLLRCGWPSTATAQIRELSQIVALSMYSPSSRRQGKTSRSMFGPVVGSSRNDPQYSFVFGSSDTRYNGLASSNSSLSYPSFTVTSQPSRSEKVAALLRNIASISLGNEDAREPSIYFNIVASPLLRDHEC